MAFTLVEYAKGTQSELARGVIEVFLSTSEVLMRLPFKEIVGNSYTFNRETRLPGIAFRAINTAYDESTGVINPITEHLKILGGDADTDKALMKWEKNFGERRANDLAMKSKAQALYFTKIFFDGDEASDPLQFDGLNNRLTGDQAIEAATNGTALTEALLNQLIDAVIGKPDVLFMGKRARRQINNLANSSTILSIGKDEFGRAVEMYAGIPIAIIEEDNDDDTILDFDETQGNSDVCASYYAVRFGADQFVSGLQTEPPEVVDLGELDLTPVFRTRLEWLVSMTIFNSKSAARLQGITASVA